MTDTSVLPPVTTLLPRPRSWCDVRSVKNIDGMTDEEKLMVQKRLRYLKPKHLDEKKVWDQQDPLKIQKLVEEACAEFPFLAQRYEGAWPIEAILRSRLSTSASHAKRLGKQAMYPSRLPAQRVPLDADEDMDMRDELEDSPEPEPVITAHSKSIAEPTDNSQAQRSPSIASLSTVSHLPPLSCVKRTTYVARTSSRSGTPQPNTPAYVTTPQEASESASTPPPDDQPAQKKRKRNSGAPERRQTSLDHARNESLRPAPHNTVSSASFSSSPSSRANVAPEWREDYPIEVFLSRKSHPELAETVGTRFAPRSSSSRPSGTSLVGPGVPPFKTFTHSIPMPASNVSPGFEPSPFCGSKQSDKPTHTSSPRDPSEPSADRMPMTATAIASRAQQIASRSVTPSTTTQANVDVRASMQSEDEELEYIDPPAVSPTSSLTSLQTDMSALAVAASSSASSNSAEADKNDVEGRAASAAPREAHRPSPSLPPSGAVDAGPAPRDFIMELDDERQSPQPSPSLPSTGAVEADPAPRDFIMELDDEGQRPQPSPSLPSGAIRVSPALRDFFMQLDDEAGPHGGERRETLRATAAGSSAEASGSASTSSSRRSKIVIPDGPVPFSSLDPEILSNAIFIFPKRPSKPAGKAASAGQESSPSSSKGKAVQRSAAQVVDLTVEPPEKQAASDTDAVKAFLHNLVQPLDDLLPVFVAAGVNSSRDLRSLAALPKDEQLEFLRNDLNINALSSRLILSGLKSLRG